MSTSPGPDSQEALAEALNEILYRYDDNPKEADQSICELLAITLPEDGVLYAEDVFEATKAAGLRIQFKLLKDGGEDGATLE
ncbi:hypothetical protein [Brevundimonas sp. ZS04]|uniref:hypothetical protein n=1 Tax=Brevundimonas sp. ZS04 TaxID=1906854 RepID=UPI00096F7B01|nr:hypothetical protein [Brevundimonas sp. ZS04]OMG57642.1 hypothetical protein BJP32_12135 [Brevundimonas sp. ZS04]